MNARERNLLIALIVIVGGFGGYFVGLQLFLNPLKESNAKIAELRDDTEKLEEQMRAFQRDRKKLEVGRRKSLPALPAQASSEYIHYLSPLLRDSGLVVEEITPSPAVEMKFVSSIPGIKKVGHQLMTFQIRAKGELGNLVKAMESLQKTPYEHRIKNFTVVRDSASMDASASSKLIISMQIEVLLVAKTESKPGMLPGIDPNYFALDSLAARSGHAPMGWGILTTRLMLSGLIATGPDSKPRPMVRHYEDIARKNIFVGGKKTQITKGVLRPDGTYAPDEGTETEKGVEPPAEFVPMFVRVMFNNGQDNEVHLRNFVHDVAKVRLITNKASYDTFRITDEEKRFDFFDAKVLRIDARDMYFQVKDKVFCIHTGESFAEAMYIPKITDNPKSWWYEDKVRERDRLVKKLTAGGLTATEIRELKLVNNLSEERLKALDLKKLYDDDWAKGKRPEVKSFKWR